MSTKYHSAVKTINNIGSILMSYCIGLGAAGVGLLSTIIAALIVIATEATALATGLLGIIGNQSNKTVIRKAAKHEKIKILTEAKLDTISDMISKALIDNDISGVEYTRILNELIKYREIKEERWPKSKKMINEEACESKENAIGSLFDKNCSEH